MSYKTTIEKHGDSLNIIFTTSKGVVKYEFQKVTVEELLAHRRSGVPGVVFKDENSFYYAKLIDGMEKYFNSIHICGKSGSECKHLSTASDENGGCAKVRDVFLPTYFNKNSVTISGAKMIEKYHFIRSGIEIFNSAHFMLNVSKCNRYEKVAPRTNSANDLSLSQQMWNEDDERRRKEAYLNRYAEA